ncbi:hypothetical protein ED312_10440 [Sinomicrobium pectinilyticum]|uniref:Uncharacterized protein n=1 Tax=Sinomicrobium pectinilyticum TaxID=1084421 RepID=A0A3N0EHC8_SINP1|nr:hypothetical protein [Sinomicrobium pectinilyticum]RNL87221.1 hypothetical protein ED312_10440 [Sinomicrobium pectinilyticum]
MVIEIIISEIDFYITQNIREKRILSGMSQQDLSCTIGESESYFRNVEDPKHPQKMDHRMLAKAARALKIERYEDIYPEKVPKHDLVKIRLKLLKKENDEKEIDENGNVIPNMEIIFTKYLSEKEINEFKIREGRDKFLKIISNGS